MNENKEKAMSDMMMTTLTWCEQINCYCVCNGNCIHCETWRETNEI